MAKQLTLRDLRNAVKSVAKECGLSFYKDDEFINDLTYRLIKGERFKFSVVPFSRATEKKLQIFQEFIFTEKSEFNLVKFKESLLAEKYGSHKKITIKDLIYEVKND